MGGVVAGNIAQITLDTFLWIDSRNGFEGKVEIPELRDVLKTASCYLLD